MSKSERKSRGKLLNPTFFVFCEGETEEQYISYLRSKYRLPIEIISKVAGNRITNKYIVNCKKDKTTHEKDKTFLVYDLDVPEMLEKLKAISNAEIISSNPCFELWYLLHYQEHNAEISTNECELRLINHHPKYVKGKLDLNLKTKIEDKQEKAIHRSKKLKEFKNPSTQVYKLIEKLEMVKKLKY